MRVSALRVHQFRCFSSLACELADGVNLFTGDNAQGKTSILESVCVLLRLQSPRTSATADLVKFDSNGFGIRATLGETELSHSWQAGKRKLALDGDVCRRSSDYLASSGLVVWMGNEDIQLVRGAGEGRRRYLDFIGSQLFPDYRPALLAYEKALRSRNFLLKRDASPSWRQIDAYSDVLVRHGEILIQRRAQLVEFLQPWAAEAHACVGGNKETLAIDYHCGATSPESPDAGFAESLAASQPHELRRRVTLVGPHRDDLALKVDQRSAGQYASEGQQRTVALALKLAQARLLQERRQITPVILVDDIFGELDPSRRNALLNYLPADAQKLITTTHLGWLDDTPASSSEIIRTRFQVSAGTVAQLL
ncbi:MAG: DNA replication and repair protein RecF [Verrucomicrobiales bacterium]|jgi:DNA replication and repair protein RecF